MAKFAGTGQHITIIKWTGIG